MSRRVATMHLTCLTPASLITHHMVRLLATITLHRLRLRMQPSPPPKHARTACPHHPPLILDGHSGPSYRGCGLW